MGTSPGVYAPLLRAHGRHVSGIALLDLAGLRSKRLADAWNATVQMEENIPKLNHGLFFGAARALARMNVKLDTLLAYPNSGIPSICQNIAVNS